MPRTPGQRPKPIEERRRTGNPGKRALPPAGSLTVLPAASTPPPPSRALRAPGKSMWERIWTSGATWLAADVDAETVLVLCEQIDERAVLRAAVFADNDWRDRAQLRALTKDIVDTLGMLGFNPTDRVRLSVAEVQETSPLDDLIARRQQRSS